MNPTRDNVPQVVPSVQVTNPSKGDGTENGLLAPNQELSKTQQAAAGEQGQSGTLISGGGFITFEEYNQNLIGRKGLKTYDQMRKSDATVQQSLKVVKQPILSAVYSITPASDDPQDAMIAAFVEDNLFNGEINFHGVLREALTMLEFGFAACEVVMDFDQWAGYTHEEEIRTPQAPIPQDAPPVPKPTNPNAPAAPVIPPPPIQPPDKITIKKTVFKGGSFLMLKKLAFRRQLTVYRWQTEKGTAGVTQMTYTGGMFSIDQDKLAIFTHEQEGDNFEGVSILRPAYMHWYYKDVLYKIQAMAMQRQGMGIPQLTAPEDADEISKEKAREALQALRANEQSYIEIPKGYIIDFMDMKGKTTMDATAAIDHHDMQIMKNVLASFLDLGKIRGSSGSHALSADQSRLFVQSLESIVKNICEVINKRIIKPLVDYNFTTDTYPVIECGSLADDNTSILATALLQLANADLLTPDPDLEDFIRETFKLPKLPDEIKADYNNRQRAQSPTVPDMTPPEQEDKPNTAPDSQEDADEIEASEIVELAQKFHRRVGRRIDALSKRA